MRIPVQCATHPLSRPGNPCLFLGREGLQIGENGYRVNLHNGRGSVTRKLAKKFSSLPACEADTPSSDLFCKSSQCPSSLPLSSPLRLTPFPWGQRRWEVGGIWQGLAKSLNEYAAVLLCLQDSISQNMDLQESSDCLIP